MNEVKSVEQLSLILGYIVPGLIILWVRAQFLTGRMAPHKDALLSYFTLSVVFLALEQAVTTLVTGSDALFSSQTRYWLSLSLTGSALFGLIVGLNASLGLSRWVLGEIGISVPHALDSAWDWKFSRFEPSLVMLTLKDGSRISGWCGDQSFIGSNPKDRDFYIEQVYDVDAEGRWTLRTTNKGIYVAGGEIRLVEFIPGNGGAGGWGEQN